MEEKDYRASAENPDTVGHDAGEPVGEPPLRWQFGAPPVAAPKAKRSAGRFYIVFGAVVAVTLALLMVLLFVGEAGISIYRTVTHERTIYVREEGSDGKLLTPAEAADVVRASTVTVSVKHKEGQGIGSGFVYRADGYICTNHHVIDDALEIQVVLPSGEAFDAVLVGSDEAADIAVLKIDKTDLVAAKIGTSATLLVGEDVVAVGTPHSLEYSGTATFGKVSYTNRILSIKNSDQTVAKKLTVIQTDTAVNNGNSGGPLANMYGEVIGIVALKQAYTNNGLPVQGVGFALPIDGAKIIVDAIIATGKFTGENPIASGRTLLGVTGRGLKGGYWYSDPKAEELLESPTEVQGYFQMPRDGVYVTEVSGLGAIGKIKPGDIIIKVNGLRMYHIYDVIGEINRHQAGESVRVTLLRPDGGDYIEKTVEITLVQG
ncbi:MAG: trypsin-like peptidase domain-containing protein [Clostridia bacterium]|nr:trypsin-like peptidase domain-containing protein [Clostridia bacterium]